MVPNSTHATDKTGAVKIPTLVNGVLYSVFYFSQVYLLFLFPLAYRQTPEAAIAGLVTAVLFFLPAWYLMHEAVHDHLFENKKVGFQLGRAMSVVCGVPFTGIRVAHLLHHRWNRIEEYSETYEPARENWLSANARYFFLVLGGLYWVEFLGGVVIFVPAFVRLKLSALLAGDDRYMQRLYQGMNSPKNVQTMKTESLLIVAAYVGAIELYGAHLWPVLAVVLLIRAFLVSFFDNAFHYDSGDNPGDNSKGTRNHSLPGSWLILNFNYHWTHHRNPGAPWNALPRLAEHDGTAFDGNHFLQALRQFQGAIPESSMPLPVKPRERKIASIQTTF